MVRNQGIFFLVIIVFLIGFDLMPTSSLPAQPHDGETGITFGSGGSRLALAGQSPAPPGSLNQIGSTFKSKGLDRGLLSTNDRRGIVGVKEIDKTLLEAVQENEIEKVKGLIAQGASVNARTEFGETPLHLAQSKEMVELLLSKGADIHAKDNEFGMTPLFNAPKEIFKLLISQGADVNARSKKGLTPLAWSAYGDDLDRIKLLISKGADVNSVDEYLKTPLHIASNWNKVEIVKLLISKGANVNARDRSGWTPLHWASFEGGPEVVELLITKGAEKNAKTTQSWSLFPAGSTPLDISEKAKHYDMAAFLKSKGCQRGEDVK